MSPENESNTQPVAVESTEPNLGAELEFKMCTTCAVKEPHGYFFPKGEEERFPVMIISVRAGAWLADQHVDAEVFGPEMKDVLVAQMKTAGLPEELDGDIEGTGRLLDKFFEEMSILNALEDLLGP